ncbi:MAG: hypothetical protein CMG13_03145 [Candidatus Marinimicrobia bacterium]|nr:hypothetical protein [Candidatus Neomarinimicrobiota bacterium]
MKTISDTIKNYNHGSIHNYYLYGDDNFLESFFINQVSKKFIKDGGDKLFYHLSVDSEASFLNDLKSRSLFESRKIIICWGINKLSKTAKEEFLGYIDSPSNEVSVIVISPDFRIKNKFISTISSKMSSVDIRTPFPSKMKSWVRYYAKSNHISLTKELIDFYVDYYGDNLSNVINEIDKHRLYMMSQRLDISDEYSSYIENERGYHYWQFLDSLGQKKMSQTFQIYRSMVANGVSHNYILMGLANLFLNIYSKNIYLNMENDFPILNKMLSRNLDLYSSKYKTSESLDILKDLHDIDKMIKTFKYGIDYKFELLILKACNNV